MTSSIRNKRARGARGKSRGRGAVTTKLADDSDDTAYTDAVADGTDYESEEQRP